MTVQRVNETDVDDTYYASGISGPPCNVREYKLFRFANGLIAERAVLEALLATPRVLATPPAGEGSE